jgi:hypothetical protein
MIRLVAWLLAAGAVAGVAGAQARKPPLPPGVDPGGVAIAILSTGIDYTRADIAQRLARDGEGNLIGWDFVDGDIRPFNARSADTPAAWGGDANELIRAVGRGGRRVVPVRIDTGDPISLAKAAAFIAQTPARIVVVPMSTRGAAEWEALGMAIKAFPDLLFIAAAGDEGRDIDPDWPAALAQPNVLVVSASGAAGANFGRDTVAALAAGSASSRMAAIAIADALAGCSPQLLQQFRGASLKTAWLAQAAKSRPGAEKPIIEPCPEGASATTRR